MQTRSFLEIWLLSVDFEKFISINYQSDQSQPSTHPTVSGRSANL